MDLSFKARISSRKYIPSLGSSIKPLSLQVARDYAALNFEWLLLDGDLACLETIQEIVLMLKNNKDCILRISVKNIDSSQNILKTGCDGIIVSEIKTPEQAKLAAEICQKYAGDRQAIILEIECNLESILRVRGFDSVLINSANLSQIDLEKTIEEIKSESNLFAKFQDTMTAIDIKCFEWGATPGIITDNLQHFFDAEECSIPFVCLDIDSIDVSKQILNNILAKRNTPCVFPIED